MRTCLLTFAGLFVLYALLSGCTHSLPQDLVALDHVAQCPQWTLAQLENSPSLFDHSTETLTLQCALDLLRSSKPAPIQLTSAGSYLCFLLADRTSWDPVQRGRYASEGVRWAETALKEGGKKNGAVHYYLAVNLGIAVKEHAALAFKHLKRLVDHLEQAIELAPDVDYAGPYRVLGMLYLLAPPWPQGIGDGDRALELLHEAVQRYPDHPQNQIFYARALWEMEAESARPAIRNHLKEGLKLLNQKQWLNTRERWIYDVRQVAEDADIVLCDHTAPE